MANNILREDGITIGMNAFTELTPPTNSQILADQFQSYKWTVLPFKETLNSPLNTVKMFLIGIPNGDYLVLKKLKLSHATDVMSYQNLKMSLDKEVDALNYLRKTNPSFMAEIVSVRHYVDQGDNYLCADVLFKVPGNNFTTIVDSIRANPRMEPIDSLIDFLCKVEDSNVPYGTLLGYNNIVMQGSNGIIVLGLGLTEAKLAHKIEDPAKIKADNARTIVEYIKIVNPLAVPNSQASSVRELRAALVNPSFSPPVSEEHKTAEYVAVGDWDGQTSFKDAIKGASPKIVPSDTESPYASPPVASEGCKKKSFVIAIGILTFLVVLFLILMIVFAVKFRRSKDDVDTCYRYCNYYNNGNNNNYNDCWQYSSELSRVRQKVDSYTWLYESIEKLLKESEGKRLLDHTDLKYKSASEKVDYLIDLIVRMRNGYRRIQVENQICTTIMNTHLYQSVKCDDKTEFDDYNVYNLDDGLDLYRDEDKKTVVLGTYSSRPDAYGKKEGTLVFTDSEGKVTDTKHFEDSIVNSMIKTTDGGLLLAGYTKDDSESWIKKWDEKNDEKWAYKDDDLYKGVRGIIEDDDGVIGIGVEVKDTDANKLWIAKVKKKKIAWKLDTAEFAHSSDPESISPMAIIMNTNRNNYIVIGGEENVPFFTIVQGDGTMIKHKRLDTENDLKFKNIIETSEGFILSLGDWSSDSWKKLYTMDFDGENLSELPIVVDTTIYTYEYQGLVAIPNGFIVGGKICKGTACGNWIGKFDLLGAKTWENKFAGGNVKKLKYENGKILVLGDLYNGVSVSAYTLPST